MRQYVLLFRLRPTQLSEAEQERRSELVLAWAARLNAEGHRLDPRKLGGEQRVIGPDVKVAPVAADDRGPVTNILFVEAHDFAEAVRIAESYPGLQFGASIEVRETQTFRASGKRGSPSSGIGSQGAA